jgi:ankyrin repeat protein
VLLQQLLNSLKPVMTNKTEENDIALFYILECCLILRQRFCLTDEKISQEDKEAFEDIEQSNVILFSFVRHDRFEAVQQLLEEHNDLIKSEDPNKNTLLHVACQNNHRRISKFLLRMGVDINAQNRNGNTALHYAYAYKFSQLSEILIQYGADSVITNNEGLVPSQGLGQIEEQEAASKSNMPLS